MEMCTYYTDINKVCLNDPYPLPNIDTLVDITLGYKTFNFLDAFNFLEAYSRFNFHDRHAKILLQLRSLPLNL